MTMSQQYDQHFRQLLKKSASSQRTPGRSTSGTKKQARSQQRSRRKKSSRKPQFNVTITDRERLDALSEKLGLARSSVINLALAELAAKHGL